MSLRRKICQQSDITHHVIRIVSKPIYIESSFSILVVMGINDTKDKRNINMLLGINIEKKI